jgi:hypothetical protein
MNQSFLEWIHVPFWIVNYGLAVVFWTCLGRFLLFIFVVGRHEQNYIWRAFLGLTNWWVRPVAFVTPRLVSWFYIPLVAAFWIYVLRVALFLVLRYYGLTPSVPGLAPPGGG